MQAGFQAARQRDGRRADVLRFGGGQRRSTARRVGRRLARSAPRRVRSVLLLVVGADDRGWRVSIARQPSLADAAAVPGRLLGHVDVFARQHVQGLLPHDHMAGRSREDGHQADCFLVAARFIPGDPDAIRRAEARLAEVGSELFGGKGVLPRGNLGGLRLVRVVVGVDDQLPLDRHGLVHRVVKVKATAEAANRLAVGLEDHVRRPDSRQSSRRRKLAFGDLGRLRRPRQLPAPVGHGLASRQAQDDQTDGHRAASRRGMLSLRAIGHGLRVRLGVRCQGHAIGRVVVDRLGRSLAAGLLSICRVEAPAAARRAARSSGRWASFGIGRVESAASRDSAGR